MEKSKNQQQNPNKKIKTKGSVYIPGGLEVCDGIIKRDQTK